jgi:hypothetical protein
MADEHFKQRLFSWMESIIKHDLSSDTHLANSPTPTVQKQCLMRRPPHPDDADFHISWPQFLREILDASGQIHKHNETCYKKTPFSMAALNETDRDRLCRFQLPNSFGSGNNNG